MRYLTGICFISISLFLAIESLQAFNLSKLYINPKLGFSIKYPPGTKIEERKGITHEYVRLDSPANDQDRKELGPKDFFIEIFVVPKKFWGEQYGWRNCKKSIENPKSITLNGSRGFRGLEEDTVESAGLIDKLCFETNTVLYRVNGTGCYKDMSLVHAILNTFTLLPQKHNKSMQPDAGEPRR